MVLKAIGLTIALIALGDNRRVHGVVLHQLERQEVVGVATNVVAKVTGLMSAEDKGSDNRR